MADEVLTRTSTSSTVGNAANELTGTVVIPYFMLVFILYPFPKKYLQVQYQRLFLRDSSCFSSFFMS